MLKFCELILLLFAFQDRNLFSLNADDGKIYLSKQTGSSSRDIREHTLNVTVYDPIEPNKLYDNAQVKVHILDSNDHAPVFSRIRYLFTVSKKSKTDFVGKFYSFLA